MEKASAGELELTELFFQIFVEINAFDLFMVRFLQGRQDEHGHDFSITGEVVFVFRVLGVDNGWGGVRELEVS